MKDSPYYTQALRLHQQVPVVDTHNDLAGELLIRHRRGEEHVLERLYLPHWKAAHFQLIVSSIYIENSVFYPMMLQEADCQRWDLYWNKHELNWEQGFKNTLAQIESLKREIQECSDELILVTSVAELDVILNSGKIGILMYMEGLDCIGADLQKLEQLYELGIRGASLTWSRPNLIATGCCRASQSVDIPGAITDYGMTVIHRMQELGMFLDISHLNNEGFSQLASRDDISFLATHSNAFSIYANYRNLTDAQMHELARHNGIMGLNACMYIVGCTTASASTYKPIAERTYESASTSMNSVLDAMCKHIEYIVKTIGASHVGFGFDLCDSYTAGKLGYADTASALHAASLGETSFEREDCLQNHEEALLLTARLLERGMDEKSVLLIISQNWWNYFYSHLPKR